MQIQLKQREIETALKLYISRQGIDLTGKAITIDFTAGRKDSGLSAELSIEEDAMSVSALAAQAMSTIAVTPPEADPAAKPVSLFNSGKP